VTFLLSPPFYFPHLFFVTKHPELKSQIEKQRYKYVFSISFFKFLAIATTKKAMENFHRFTGASCLTRTGDTLINSQVL